MSEAQVTELTTAFAPGQLFATWVDFAPFILGGIGVLIAIAVVSGIVRRVRARLGGGVG